MLTLTSICCNQIILSFGEESGRRHFTSVHLDLKFQYKILKCQCWCTFKDLVQLVLVGVSLGTKLLRQAWEQDWELALEEVCFRVHDFC